MVSGAEWLDAFLRYDFDDLYFNDVNVDAACEYTNKDNSNSECDNKDEVEFEFVNPLVGEMFAYMQQHYDKQPMCTSVLTRNGYMEELKKGNPKKCFEMFCMTWPLLLHLVDELRGHGYLRDGQGDVDSTQAVAMFLYILGHNTRLRCVADSWPPRTSSSEQKCVRAIDGSHASAQPPSNTIQVYRSRKSSFTCVHAGWEGSANDPRVLDEAISDLKHGFPWPPTGSYYLVDSSFPIGTSFLPPHKSTRYHAQEFRSSNRQSIAKKELYNYRHSLLRMVIERLFRVLKAHFPILNLMPNFKRSRQRYVIVPCYALHNFICMNNHGDELFHTWAGVEETSTQSEASGNSKASNSAATQRHVLEMLDAAKRLMTQFRDDITDLMWVDYVAHWH
ncbi:uncharacterized protein LOC142627934 [Castanea sativa]|uniref:uncharacterized protein LOC142627934 n=1 Tax=Castanea sativa TaxID=21020 RepID=UPI003F64BBAB